MSYRKSAVAVALVTAVLASHALAQPASKAEAAPTLQTMPGGLMSGGMMFGGGDTPMMSMMRMLMAQGAMGQMGATGQMGGMMARHVEGRIAFLKAELKITETQLPLWNAVGAAMRANAKTMMEMSGGMIGTSADAALPDKLAPREKALTARLDALRKYSAAVDPLYAALSDEQKKKADELMSGPMGMGMGGMGMGMIGMM